MPVLDRAKQTANQRRARDGGREVGLPDKPSKAWSAKRKVCAGSLEKFCLTFLPEKFFLPFADDHRAIIAKLERIVRKGGLLAIAMPRGSGKTELVKAAALWAILYGYRRFVVIVGAAKPHADRIIEDLKSTLAYNDMIDAAFPEATTYPRDLNGVVHRARVQTIEGRPSGLEWTAGGIRLAFVPKAKCSGAVIRTAGLTGSIRGMSATGPKGETIRPDLVLCDDPQDRESATSLSQTEDRERIVRGDVLGLAGPTKSISCVMPCTVVAKDDLADRFLDRSRNPQWNGERTKLMYAFPTNTALWDEYFALRDDSLRAGGDGTISTEFYRENQAAMDAGAQLAWEQRYDADRYASAIEEAMVRRHDDPEAFAAEMQNEPIDIIIQGFRKLKHEAVSERVTGLPRFTVPRECTRVASFIDCGGEILWYATVAMDEYGGGGVIDYGTYPKQNRRYFTKRDPRPALTDLLPRHSEEQRVYAGLSVLSEEILSREYIRDVTGDRLKVERCLVDAGKWTSTIFKFCRASPYTSILLPSMGRAMSKSAASVADWKPRPGEPRPGWHWRKTMSATERGWMVQFDADSWKDRLYECLTTPAGGKWYLGFFSKESDGKTAANHEMIGHHCEAEWAEPEEKTMRGIAFHKWNRNPSEPDNDLFDCLVGCLVAASVQGLVWSATDAPTPVAAPKKKVKLSDLYFRKHGERVT